MVEVLFTCSTGDQEVINVVETKVETAQHLIHEPLERLSRIPEAKGHADKFVQAEWSNNGSLWHIVRFH